METQFRLSLKINRGGNSFLLESVEGGQRLARYSFIAPNHTATSQSGQRLNRPAENYRRRTA